MESKHLISVVFGAAGFFFVTYVMMLFCLNLNFYDRLEGCWKGVDFPDEYVFADKTYTYGAESGTYKIHLNKIMFVENHEECLITIRKDFLIIDGDFYLRN